MSRREEARDVGAQTVIYRSVLGKDAPQRDEVEREEQRHDVVGDRAEDLGRADEPAVDGRAAADRSDDADGHADGDEDDGREDRQRERVGEAGEEDLTHRASGAEGEPEARRTAVDHVAGVGEVAAHEQSTEVLGELLPQRTVEPEVGPDRRQLLRCTSSRDTSPAPGPPDRRRRAGMSRRGSPG